MKLIVWLGNPGKKYENTRHNAGFLALDSFAKREKISWTANKDRNAEIGKWKIKDEDIIICKPLTFMNKSGESVGKIAQFFKIKPEDILVIHDEIDLPSGQIQMKSWGGHAGHNGLRDIIAKLGTNTFSRIRIGVGRPETKEEVVDYVLYPFSKGELQTLADNEQKIWDMIYAFIEK